MDDLFGKMQELLADPESMKQISELAQMLQNESDAASEPHPAPADSPPPESNNNIGIPFDPMMLMKIGELLGTAQKPDENTTLLMALRPHLREERRDRVDRAVRLLRLMTVWNTLKESGMLQNFL